MKLVQNRTAFHGVIMITAAIGSFGFSGRIAKAGPIPISFNTTGTFSPGTPADLTYTPISFAGTTSEDGFLVLPDLGQFSLGGSADDARFHGDSFTLHFDFLTPLGVIGSVDFLASLSGHINDNGDGNVHVNFTPNSEVIAFANVTNSGSFTLIVNDVTGLRQDGAVTATGSVTNAVAPEFSAPEPGSFMLFGSALVALSCIVRRKIRR